MFKQTPKCEACGSEDATSFSYVGEPGKGRWIFSGACTSETEVYYIEVANFFGHPAASVDWLAHIHEKGWVNWNDFMDMMVRFRQATDSFNAL